MKFLKRALKRKNIRLLFYSRLQLRQAVFFTATITITPKVNYTTIGIAENGYSLNSATSLTNEADSNVITAVFPQTTGSGSGVALPLYTVKFDTNGAKAIASQKVAKNSKATEPTKPEKAGYIFEGWYTDFKLTAKYNFDAAVTANITLYAKWVADDHNDPAPNTGKDDNKPQSDEWKNPFTDVAKSDWFFESVKYANKNNLMSGINSTEFAPHLSLTRGMLVTFLYRMAGKPAANKSIPFTDVKSNSYYRDAVIWANQNGIVSVINEMEFAPDENITREQIAVIIHRYAKLKGYDVSVGENTNILSYSDFDKISEYAIEAMQYAVGSGLLKGKSDSTLNPRDNAARAEIAAILQRFIESNK